MKFPLVALLCALPAIAAERPLVVYVGGAKATLEQVQCWAEGARRDAKYGKSFQFKAFPYPVGATLGHGSDKTRSGRNTIVSILSFVEAQDVNRPLIVVGHSSGSDIANAVAQQLIRKNRAGVSLIDLDGYGVPSDIASRIPTTCWTAHGRLGHSSQTTNSPYWREAHGACAGAQVREMWVNGCDSIYCLHFRLTNKEARRDMNDGNYGTDGYSSGSGACVPNLDWLED